MTDWTADGDLQAPRLKVLVSAFACCPPTSPRFSGGEDVLGWHLIQQIGRFHDVWVLTHAVDREDIERAPNPDARRRVRFVFVGLPRWLLPLARVPGGIQCYCYLWQIRAYFVARRLTRTVRFDIVHHLTYANDWMASFIGALLPLPFVRGPGGGAQRIPQTFLRECSLRGRMEEYVRTLGQRVFRLDPIFNLGQRRARALLLCNVEALAATPSRWRAKTSLFPVNGINTADLPVVSDASHVHADRRFLVCSAGKLIQLKGFALAIRAFAQFAVERAGVLEIVGSGPDQPRLEALTRSLGLGQHVRFVPWLPREQLLKRLGQADVFLFSSLRDGGGAVVVEAMAAGKPVVCLRLGGAGMHVTPDCGFPIAADNPEQAVADMSAALRRLYDDPALRRRLGVAAQERVRAVYDWDRLGERLATVYADVMGQRGLSHVSSMRATADALAQTCTTS